MKKQTKTKRSLKRELAAMTLAVFGVAPLAAQEAERITQKAGAYFGETRESSSLGENSHSQAEPLPIRPGVTGGNKETPKSPNELANEWDASQFLADQSIKIKEERQEQAKRLEAIKKVAQERAQQEQSKADALKTWMWVTGIGGVVIAGAALVLAMAGALVFWPAFLIFLAGIGGFVAAGLLSSEAQAAETKAKIYHAVGSIPSDLERK